ncbi:hypothetical protein PC128_g24631 [Phytophthora cactorum]|nr:hypothetical protein PC128_g24631 [Phytophthora cactorum]
MREKQCAFTPLFEFQVLECVESSLQDALKSLFFCDFWTGPAPAERLVATSGVASQDRGGAVRVSCLT